MTFGTVRPTYSNEYSITGETINCSNEIYCIQGNLEWKVGVPNNKVIFRTKGCNTETSHGFPHNEVFSDMDCVTNIACQSRFDKDNLSNPVIAIMPNKHSDCTISDSISNIMYVITTLGSIQKQAEYTNGHSQLQEIKSSDTLFAERSQISEKDHRSSKFEPCTKTVLIEADSENLKVSANRDAKNNIHKETKVEYKCNADVKSVTGNSKIRTQFHGEAHECGHCGKKFTQSGNWQKHEKIHLKIKKYKCNVCEKSFTQKQNLKRHSRTNTGEKPYECVFCRKKFSSLSSFRTRKEIHTGIKRFKFNVCEKLFRTKQNLLIHALTYTNDKPPEFLLRK